MRTKAYLHEVPVPPTYQPPSHQSLTCQHHNFSARRQESAPRRPQGVASAQHDQDFVVNRRAPEVFVPSRNVNIPGTADCIGEAQASFENVLLA